MKKGSRSGLPSCGNGRREPPARLFLLALGLLGGRLLGGAVGADRLGGRGERRVVRVDERARDERGHRLVEANGAVFGGYQAVWRDPRTLVYFGASESRKDGCALGY